MMMDDDSELGSVFKKVLLSRLQLYYQNVEMAHPLQNLQVHEIRSMMADQIIRTIAWEVAGLKEVVVDVRFPVTWWDAFKDRWFPKFMLKRWPAQFREIHVDKMTAFPAISLPPNCGKSIVVLTKNDRFVH